jgi:hypothetical protein
MILIETRPSLYDRLTGNVQLSPRERQEYMEKLLKIEEEKEEMARLAKETQEQHNLNTRSSRLKL